MILPASQKPKTQRIIDLNSPEGNAHYLMGLTQIWSKQLGKDTKAIIAEMMSSDYENLVKVFDSEFGDYCVIYK